MPKLSRDPSRELPSDEDSKQRELAVSGASAESIAPRSRRSYPASEKLRIVRAADAALASGERGALQALLRREGLYNSHLTAWRAQLTMGGASALTSQKPGRKSKLDDHARQLLALEKRNAVLERKLHIANALISLQKKAQEILAIALPEHDDEET